MAATRVAVASWIGTKWETADSLGASRWWHEVNGTWLGFSTGKEIAFNRNSARVIASNVYALNVASYSHSRSFGNFEAERTVAHAICGLLQNPRTAKIRQQRRCSWRIYVRKKFIKIRGRRASVIFQFCFVSFVRVALTEAACVIIKSFAINKHSDNQVGIFLKLFE